MKLKALLHDYSIGNLTTNFFFQNLKTISKYPSGAIPIQDWFVEKRLIGPFPGAAALLSKLAGLGVRIILFSNTNETHWNQVNEYAFAHSYAFVSFLMKRKKPDPNAFRDVEHSTHIFGEEIIFLMIHRSIFKWLTAWAGGGI